jgi:hypothetical protein
MRPTALTGLLPRCSEFVRPQGLADVILPGRPRRVTPSLTELAVAALAFNEFTTSVAARVRIADIDHCKGTVNGVPTTASDAL